MRSGGLCKKREITGPGPGAFQGIHSLGSLEMILPGGRASAGKPLPGILAAAAAFFAHLAGPKAHHIEIGGGK